MLRRSFLQYAASILAGTQILLQTIAPEPEPKLKFFDKDKPAGERLDCLTVQVDGRVVLLKGNPDDVRDFCEAYQTNLWPEWRTHKNDMARRQMKQMRPSLAAGLGGVSVGDRQQSAAYVKTLAEWDGVPLKFPTPRDTLECSIRG